MSWASAFRNLGISNALRANGGRHYICVRTCSTPCERWQGLAMGRGDMEVLDQEASEMIRLEPASPEGYALRALSNVNRKRFSAAEVDVKKAIEVAPQSSFGYVQMGNLKYAGKRV